MNYILIGYLIFILAIFAITSVATKKFVIGVMVLLTFVVIGYILTILPMIAIMLTAIGMTGLIAFYLTMRGDNNYGN